MNPKYSVDSFGTSTHTNITAVDLNRLAQLHLKCLPGSVFSRLGSKVTQLLYKYLFTSEYERVTIIRDDTFAVVGASVVSFSTNTLVRRLVWYSNPFLKNLVRENKLITESLKTNDAPIKDLTPELVFIYVDPELRSQGIGKALLEMAHGEAVRNGFTAISIVTARQANNPAIKFYLQNGYVMDCKLTRGFTACIKMIKSLRTAIDR